MRPGPAVTATTHPGDQAVTLFLDGVVNLDTAITRAGEPWPGKGIHYRMHPTNVPCLGAAGIGCCALANNHVLDRGYPGCRKRW
jgi:poly-gamma-glutamate capsule biosynthesis protein CapA/YwtB (metallophosphatase superfamily)